MSYTSSGPSFALPTLTPAIKRLMIANGVLFLLNALLGGRLSEGDASGGFWFACSWEKLWEGYGLGVLRLVSYQFTHSWGDPMHLLWNMLTLYFFGTMAETSLGYLGTYKLYLVGGLAGVGLHLLLAWPMGHPNVNLVGASGSCYAFLLYAACMNPRGTVFLLVIPVMFWVLATILVFLGVYATYVEIVSGFRDNVAHGAHLGGAALGFVAHKRGWFRDWQPYAYREGVRGGMFRKVRDFLQRRRALAEQRDRERLDQLLDKVRQQGLTSLSGGERKFLTRQSQKARQR